MNYGISKHVSLGFDEAVARVTDELKKEGFGILTTIDMKETLKKKINVDIDRYMILGACNPPFAYQAVQAEQEIGLLLPCNVIVYEKDGKTTVSAFDPMVMGALIDNPLMEPIARAVQDKLQKVMESLASVRAEHV